MFMHRGYVIDLFEFIHFISHWCVITNPINCTQHSGDITIFLGAIGTTMLNALPASWLSQKQTQRNSKRNELFHFIFRLQM